VADPVQVQRVDAAVTRPLRQRVLRPHETLEQLVLPGDDDPDSAHFAVLEGDEVLATGSVRREPPPWPVDGPAWRLRGMATAEDRRGGGLGGAVLAAAMAHVRDHGGGWLWCNARLPAVAFYRRAGLVTRGDPWEEPRIGPHIAMELLLGPS
jgi:GNAT superfamily N-acetyltransferase